MKASDLAIARAPNGRQQMQEIHTVDVGEGWGLLGFEVHPMVDGDTLAAVLFAVGTKQSLIAQTTMKLVKVAVAPLVEVKIEKLRAAFIAADGPKDEGPQ